MPVNARTTTAPRSPPLAGARRRRWHGWRLRLICMAVSWSLACIAPVQAQPGPAAHEVYAAAHGSGPGPGLSPGPGPATYPQRRPPAPTPRIALDDRTRLLDEPIHCPGLSGRGSETERQTRRAACLGQADPGQNGPPSQSQRAIQALTKAISVVSGKPMRRKSAKRYWPGPRMRRFP